MSKVQQASEHAPLPRRLRIAAAAAASLFVVAGAALVATQAGDGSAPAPRPVAATHASRHTQPALPGGARQGAVAVSVASPDRVFRLTMNVGCAACSTVWERDRSGAWQRLHDFGAEAYAGEVDQHYGPVEQLVMAPNGRDGWAWGQRLYSTHDAGRTWAQVTIHRTPGTVLQPTVVATSTYAWTLIYDKQVPHLYRSPVGADDWTAVPMPHGGRVNAVETVGNRVVLEASAKSLSDALMISSTDDGATWSILKKPCVGENAGSAGFLLCPPPPSTPSSGVTIYATTDFTSWSVLGRTGGISGAASVGIGRLLLVRRDHTALMTPDGTTRVHLPLGPGDQIGPSSSSGDVSYVTVYGDEEGNHEYLITSSDGGRTWSAQR